MAFQDQLMGFAHELEEWNEAAMNLWTWLPSHYLMEMTLKDYKFEGRPSLDEVMKEASLIFALLQGFNKDYSSRLFHHYSRYQDSVDDLSGIPDAVAIAERFIRDRFGWRPEND